MGRFFYWLIIIPLFAVVIVFAITNHGSTELSLWPVTEHVMFPVYGIALIGLFVGFLIGGLASWIQNGRSRRRLRELQRQSEADQREIAILRDRLASSEARERQATIPPALAPVADEMAVRP